MPPPPRRPRPRPATQSRPAAEQADLAPRFRGALLFQMISAARKSQWLVVSGAVLTMAAVGALFLGAKLNESHGPLPEFGQLPDFHLTNQDNQAISLGDL